MAQATRVPRVFRAHYDDKRQQWRVVVTAVDEQIENNQIIEVIEKFLTLAEVIAFILQVLAAISPTAEVDHAVVGDMAGVATWITASAINGHTGP